MGLPEFKWRKLFAAPTPKFKLGTTLQEIIDYGVVRDFQSSQIINEAALMDFTIDASVVDRARQELNAAMQRYQSGK